ncbi:hypothetical protein EXIGLDRAFT_840811 [Exidia glandulosa HHB12029]|nr:hypothetical protein EXIGLDRAFT_840811 [Exidia glandulosa HHB12029]
MILPPPPSPAVPPAPPPSPIASIGRPRRAAALASLRTNGAAFGLLLFSRVVIAELNSWGWGIVLRGALYWAWCAALVLTGANLAFSAYALRRPPAPLPPLFSPSKVQPKTASPAQRMLSGISKATPRRSSFAPPAPSPLSTPARMPNYTLGASQQQQQPTPGMSASASFVLNSALASSTSSSTIANESPLAYRVAGRSASQIGRPVDSGLLRQLLDSSED